MSTIIGSALKNDSQNEVVCPPEVPGCSLLCGTNGVWWTEYQAASWALLSIKQSPTLILAEESRISSQPPAIPFSIVIRTELTGHILLFSCSMGVFVCPVLLKDLLSRDHPSLHFGGKLYCQQSRQWSEAQVKTLPTAGDWWEHGKHWHIPANTRIARIQNKDTESLDTLLSFL